MNETELERISKQKQQAVDRARAILMENFDAVVILVSHEMSDGNTGNVFDSSGNIYACIGMAQTYLDREKATPIEEY